MEQEIFPEFEKILFTGTKKSLNPAEKNYKKIQTKILLENNISSKGFLIYMDNS